MGVQSNASDRAHNVRLLEGRVALITGASEDLERQKQNCPSRYVKRMIEHLRRDRKK